MLNETQIREAFHRKNLRRQHNNPSTIVVDELGLHHGRFRADIAVVNGNFVGYEIKSDSDSLRRLRNQVQGYSSVFNRVLLISTQRHINSLSEYIPQWWGIILSYRGPRGGIHFNTIRQSENNPATDDQAIARLLWRNEAVELLARLGVHGRGLKEKREILYSDITKKMPSNALRLAVRSYLIKRQNWRDRSQFVQYGG